MTRLEVDGFKNLAGVDVRLGPLTCITGANDTGKSNLLDAIVLLGDLARRPLAEALAAVRGGRPFAAGAPALRLAAETIIPARGADDLGQEAIAAITFVRYEVALAEGPGGPRLVRESLDHINLGDAWRHLRFRHRRAWRDSVIVGRRTTPLISTETDAGQVSVKLHQDLGRGPLSGGGPRLYAAEALPCTVLSRATAAENATAVLAREEMRSWRVREPWSSDELPALLERRAARDPELPERLSRHLSELLDDDVTVVFGEGPEALAVRDGRGVEHDAGTLSAGTARLLALAAIAAGGADPGRLLALEEPENGLHPRVLGALTRGLQELAVDPRRPAASGEPLRQVLLTTYSPRIVQALPRDDLLVARRQEAAEGAAPPSSPAFRWIEGTWRARAEPDKVALASEELEAELDLGDAAAPPRRRRTRRDDEQMRLPY